MRPFPKHLFDDFPELRVLTRLSTPQKIQDFLDSLRINFEKKGETARSVLETLRHKEAHCIEGAMIAAAAFWLHGRPPILLDLVTRGGDDDHVVALFKEGRRWGAVSKTNHAVLRYRDPVFRDVRELAMSYFSEYFLHNGAKTLRTFSKPFDLSRYGTDWLVSPKNLFNLTDALDHAPHTRILSTGEVRNLRRASPIERRAGKLEEWKR